MHATCIIYCVQIYNLQIIGKKESRPLRAFKMFLFSSEISRQWEENRKNKTRREREREREGEALDRNDHGRFVYLIPLFIIAQRFTVRVNTVKCAFLSLISVCVCALWCIKQSQKDTTHIHITYKRGWKRDAISSYIIVYTNTA